MPQFKTTTMQATSVWKAPDGSRELFEVVLNYNGQSVKAKTYSEDISKQGWSGEVLTYEKEGRNGLETFVKQAPKEGYAGGNSGGSNRGNYVPKDEKAIQAMWAVSQSITLNFNRANTDGNTEYLKDDSILGVAKTLMAMVSDVKGEASTDTTAPDETTSSEDVVINDIPEGPIDLSDIDSMFPTVDSEPKKQDKPWNPGN